MVEKHLWVFCEEKFKSLFLVGNIQIAHTTLTCEAVARNDPLDVADVVEDPAWGVCNSFLNES
jgi:hypothetical protein